MTLLEMLSYLKIHSSQRNLKVKIFIIARDCHVQWGFGLLCTAILAFQKDRDCKPFKACFFTLIFILKRLENIFLIFEVD